MVGKIICIIGGSEIYILREPCKTKRIYGNITCICRNVKDTKWDLQIYYYQQHKGLLKLWLEPEDQNEIMANNMVKK